MLQDFWFSLENFLSEQVYPGKATAEEGAEGGAFQDLTLNNHEKTLAKVGK